MHGCDKKNTEPERKREEGSQDETLHVTQGSNHEHAKWEPAQ